MTGNQAPPHRPGRPAAPAAIARPDFPAGHHPADRRAGGSPLAAAAKRTARYAPLLAGGTAAHGSSPSGNTRAFLMTYNELTGNFGDPAYYEYGNTPQTLTHFDGITAVPGGYNLATISTAEKSSMAFIPATGNPARPYGQATWYPIDVAGSQLCQYGCSDKITANTVYQNNVMGLYTYKPDSEPTTTYVPGTYLATVATP